MFAFRKSQPFHGAGRSRVAQDLPSHFSVAGRQEEALQRSKLKNMTASQLIAWSEHYFQKPLEKVFDAKIRLIRMNVREQALLGEMEKALTNLAVDKEALLPFNEYPRYILVHIYQLAKLYKTQWQLAAHQVQKAIKARNENKKIHSVFSYWQVTGSDVEQAIQYFASKDVEERCRAAADHLSANDIAQVVEHMDKKKQAEKIPRGASQAPKDGVQKIKKGSPPHLPTASLFIEKKAKKKKKKLPTMTLAVRERSQHGRSR